MTVCYVNQGAKGVVKNYWFKKLRWLNGVNPYDNQLAHLMLCFLQVDPVYLLLVRLCCGYSSLGSPATFSADQQEVCPSKSQCR
jgi:hypothetical protein